MPRSLASTWKRSISASRAHGSSRSAPLSRRSSPAGAWTAKNSRSTSSVRSIVSSRLECFLENRLAALELALHRVDRNAADGGQLAVPEAVHVVEGQEHARLARNGVQCARQVQALAC